MNGGYTDDQNDSPLVSTLECVDEFFSYCADVRTSPEQSFVPRQEDLSNLCR